MMTNLRRQLDKLRSNAESLSAQIGRRVQIMEVCGTHTVSFFRSGVRSLLPSSLRLVSGPGCPVCVTAQRHIDAAMEIASRPKVVLATYGDMLRVPGRHGSLERLRAHGASVRVVNSAQTALQIARSEPQRQIVFFAVGFETTAPSTAAVVIEAQRDSIPNFSIIACHKLVVPAMRALLRGGDVPLDGFLCPGHVSVIIGSEAYRPIVRRYRKPCVVAGFEPVQLLDGVVHILRQVAEREAKLENIYPAVVSRSGNFVARQLMTRVFMRANTAWRELGIIPRSGLELLPAFQRFDALSRFGVILGKDHDHKGCKCGEVIQGKTEPAECPLFDHGCTPLTPIGPCMVSGEGTCAAWYKYHRGVRRDEKSAEPVLAER